MVGKVINKIVTEKASATLVVPLWRSAPFWPKICRNDEYVSFVKEVIVFDGGIVKKGRGNNGIFGDRKSKFRMIALRIAF